MKKWFIIFFLFSFLFLAENKSLAENSADGQLQKKKALFFYQEVCQHCQNVDRYFSENGIYDKYEIKKIEISGTYNLNYFNQFFDAFQVDPDKRGWPAVFFGQTFLVGDEPIIKNFVNEIEKYPAFSFPTPDSAKEYMLKESFAGKQDYATGISLLTLSGAALTDAASPCYAAILVILASFIVLGKFENKKEIFIFGLIFLFIIGLLYLSLGMNLFAFNKVLKLSRNFNLFLSALSVFVSLFILKKRRPNFGRFVALKNQNIFVIFFKSIHDFAGKILQKITLTSTAILSGLFTSIFLLPCASRPYGIIAEYFSLEKDILSGSVLLVFYNIIFALPLAVLIGAVYWFMHLKKLEPWRFRNEKNLRMILGIVLLFVGLYLMHNWI